MFRYLFSDRRRLRAARTALEHLAPLLDARVCVRLWDGSVVPLGREADPRFALAVSSPGVVSSLLRRPSLDNVFQHYAAGRIDFQGGDLMDFIAAARVKNSRTRLRQVNKWLLARQAVPFLFYPADHSSVQHQVAANQATRPPRRHSAEFVQFHYDLGNEFYQLFLDPELMQYSCAYFTDWGNSLEQAQQDKLEMICRKLRLRPGETLFDPGCGWGGLVCYAAQHHGVQAYGTTLSRQQAEFAQEKIRRLGLQDRAKVELRDYSEVEGTFDKIASIGLMEHIGIANYPRYFQKMYALLRDRGILINHAIARCGKLKHGRAARPRAAQAVIQKYIFPGGELDHIGNTVAAMERCHFEVRDVEAWREHYSLTTKIWCQRLSANREKAEALVGSESYRMWTAYLAGFSFGFTDGALGLYQIVSTKHASKGVSGMPPTRQHLYASS